jgi:phosphoesterase RecJ-like protein
VSLRSKHGFNASQVAMNFGGGGHIKASGCKVRGTLAQAKLQLIEAVSSQM